MKVNKQIFIVLSLFIGLTILLSGCLDMQPSSDNNATSQINSDVSHSPQAKETLYISGFDNYSFLSSWVYKNYVVEDSVMRDEVIRAIESFEYDPQSPISVDVGKFSETVMDKTAIQLFYENDNEVKWYFITESGLMTIGTFGDDPGKPEFKTYQLNLESFDYSLFKRALESKKSIS